MKHSQLAWLYRFVLPYKWGVAGLAVLSLLAICVTLSAPYITKLVIDQGLLAKDFNALARFSALLFAVGLCSTILTGINRYSHTRLSGQILFSLREEVYRHLQHLSPAFYRKYYSGEILSRLDGDVAELQRFVLDGFFASVSGVIGLIGAVGFLFWLNWQLALIAVILLPLEWVYLRFMRIHVESHTRKVRERSADISSFLVETLAAMKFIQSVGAQERESKRLAGLNGHYLQGLLRLQMVEFFTQAVPSTLMSVSRAMVFLLGGYWVIQGDMELGSLIAFSSYLGMALGPVQTLLGVYVAVARMKVSLARVFDLTQSQPDIARAPEPVKLLKDCRGDIRFDHVTFSYPDEQRTVFEDACADLPAGAKVGIVGASGIGKSTLVDLLLRHFDPDFGTVQIDGKDIRRYDLVSLRRNIGIVAQDITLFRASLADNIRYANPAADCVALDQVVAQAQLDKLVARLPQGLDTIIGERGMGLSGGERQRLALARVLLQNPAILILDEATSAVDSETERQLIVDIDRLFGERSRLIVSHRPEPLFNADWMLIISDGKIKMERG